MWWRAVCEVRRKCAKENFWPILRGVCMCVCMCVCAGGGGDRERERERESKGPDMILKAAAMPFLSLMCCQCVANVLLMC